MEQVDDGQTREEDDQHSQDLLPDDGGPLAKTAQEEPDTQGSQPEGHQVGSPAESLAQQLEPPLSQHSLAGGEHAEQRQQGTENQHYADGAAVDVSGDLNGRGFPLAALRALLRFLVGHRLSDRSIEQTCTGIISQTIEMRKRDIRQAR